MSFVCACCYVTGSTLHIYQHEHDDDDYDDCCDCGKKLKCTKERKARVLSCFVADSVFS